MRKVFIAILILSDFQFSNYVTAQNNITQGMFFSKKTYQTQPLPTFNDTKNLLPSPIYDENPLWIEMYWRAWEMAFQNFREPVTGSGYVSQYLDLPFNANIFLWDMSFETMFLNVAHHLVPGICTLDNFYIKQHSTGEICREINRATGVDLEFWTNSENTPLFSRWGFDEYFNQYRADVEYKGREIPTPNPKLTLDALNHPILAWAELESYKWTGDKSRLEMVRLPLIKYYEALKKYIRQGNGLYMTDWASMDNSPRNTCLAKGGTGIDISSEMVLFARNLSELSEILGNQEDAINFNSQADSLAEIINTKMWNDERKFYFDLTVSDKLCPVKTIAGFWPLISKTSTPERAEHLVNELRNPKTFGRLHPVPSLAADEKEYYPQGGYWSGAVWVMTNTMVIKGLDVYNYNDLANEIALKHLDAVARVYQQTGTFWENYAADSIKEGINTNGAPVVKDIVGWGALAPVLYLIEYGIGLKPNARNNELVWRIETNKRTGVERFRFNGHITSLIASANDDNMKISVISDGSYNLIIYYNGQISRKSITTGENYISLKAK